MSTEHADNTVLFYFSAENHLTEHDEQKRQRQGDDVLADQAQTLETLEDLSRCNPISSILINRGCGEKENKGHNKESGMSARQPRSCGEGSQPERTDHLPALKKTDFDHNLPKQRKLYC